MSFALFQASRFLIIVSDGDVDYEAPEKARNMEQNEKVIIFSSLVAMGQEWARQSCCYLRQQGVAVGEDADVKDLRKIATSPQLFFQAAHGSTSALMGTECAILGFKEIWPSPLRQLLRHFLYNDMRRGVLLCCPNVCWKCCSGILTVHQRFQSEGFQVWHP